MNVIILSTGDELVLGQNVDTNSAWLSAQLSACGAMTVYHKTLGDDICGVSGAIRDAVIEADLVILTGGLGPTKDDITREALATVLDVPLELHTPSVQRIRNFFKKIGRPCPMSNDAQAMCPRGATMLDNNWGTAPGIAARIGQARFFAFPGVPHEMRRMFQKYIFPLLAKGRGRTILTESVVAFGAGESFVASRLGSLMLRSRNPLVGTTVSEGMITVRIRSDFASAAEAATRLNSTVGAVERRLGKLVIGCSHTSLQQVVGELLKKFRKTTVTAESCTGGLVGKMLTEPAGSSDWYRGGWIAYSNQLKETALGVPARLIARHGAVSEPVARAMAEGALSRSGADYALAVTGIAGPGGGSSRKPVGTVWLAMAEATRGGIKVTSQLSKFRGERETIRGYAAKTLLNMLRLSLLSRRKPA